LEPEKKPETSAEQNQDFNPEQHINILRKRTFNEELRGLVTRVTGNESIDVGLSGDEPRGHQMFGLQEEKRTGIDDVDNLNANQLLHSFHRLFYKVRNMVELKDSNSSFDPFQIEYSEGRFNDSLVNYIVDELKHSLLKGFALLEFDLEKKCYLPVNNRIPGLSDNEITIGINDNFLSSILSDRKGLILNSLDIGEDGYLRERFLPFLNGDNNFFLYFVSQKYISEKLFNELSVQTENKQRESIPAPIIIIHGEGITHSESDIFSLLEKRFAIPFLLLKDNGYNDISMKGTDSLNLLFLKLEYFCNKAVDTGLTTCVIISAPGMHDIQSIMVMKYLFSKIKSLLSDESIIIRISMDRIFIFVKNIMLENIKNFIDETNSLFENILTYEDLMISKNDGFQVILNRIFI